MAEVMHVRPAADEVALVHQPAGVRITVRVHTAAGPVDFTPDDPADWPELPVIVTVPGDRELLGWGASSVRCYALQAVRNGRHKLDRSVWDQAVKAVRSGGVVFVGFEQRDHYGQPRWTATGLREAK